MTSRSFLIAALTASMVAVGAAQTPVTPPDNNYSPAQDVELGRDAAAQARKQLPLLNDREVSSYLDQIGRRLVAAVPENLQHPEFAYSFQPVNVRDINAFALPGGPMFVNRGMLQASKSEGEIASVMAHELSHVVLRHGTAQASKATKYEIGQVAGAIVGAIIGGRVGSVVAQGTQFGLGAAFLRFGREYERQADLLGSQIMARAGYDPREMASMFRTLERQGGSSGPEWLSSHPNPGNRADAITKEAASLRVTNPVQNTAAFKRIQSHLGSLPRAPSTEEVAKNAAAGASAPRSARTAARVEPPSSRFTEYTEGDVFRISVPENWREMPSSSSVTFAPEGATYAENGQGNFSHGIEIGLGRKTSNLRTATNELLQALARGNPGLSKPSAVRNSSIAGRRALEMTALNVLPGSDQRELLQIVTTQMADGTLMYAIAVVPESEAGSYQPIFQRVVRSIRFLQ